MRNIWGVYLHPGEAVPAHQQHSLAPVLLGSHSLGKYERAADASTLIRTLVKGQPEHAEGLVLAHYGSRVPGGRRWWQGEEAVAQANRIYWRNLFLSLAVSTVVNMLWNAAARRLARREARGA